MSGRGDHAERGAAEGNGTLRVRLLGEFAIEGRASVELASRKARTLLKVLALARGRPVRRERLADCLWPWEAPADPAAQISVLVSRARGALGRERLVRGEGGYALLVDWLDIQALEALAAEATRRLRARRFAAAHAAASAGLALVRGPLLADEPGSEWANPERATLDGRIAGLRHSAAEAALAVGDLGAAEELAAAGLDADPSDESAARLLMATLAASGRPASALAVYAQLRTRLDEELGTTPAGPTDALHVAVLRGEPLPGLAIAATPAVVKGSAAAGVTLPGRRPELDTLDAGMSRARRGGLEIIVVEGEAGIGKTALLDAFAARAADTGATVLRGACGQVEASPPLQGVFDALRAELRRRGPNAAQRLVGEHASVVGPLLGLGAHHAAPTPLDAPIEPSLLFEALLGVLERLAAEAPLALLLDDLHLASPSTAAWLAHVDRRSARLPLLVVAARRTGKGPVLDVGATLALGPLDVRAAAALVGRARAAELHKRSGGNPLFLTELAAAAPGEPPASIVDAVTRRVSGIGAAELTLRTAALLGEVVDVDLLAIITRLDPIEAVEHLEEGVRRGVLAERGTTFVFRHELLREALVGGTTPTRAAAVHREAGRALAARPGHDPLVVARHARRGGDHALASASLRTAADLAVDRGDYGNAEELLDRSLALAEQAGTRLARARVRILRGAVAAAVDDAEAAFRDGAGVAALEAAGPARSAPASPPSVTGAAALAQVATRSP